MACRNRDCREILPLKNREIKYQYTSTLVYWILEFLKLTLIHTTVFVTSNKYFLYPMNFYPSNYN